MKDKEPGKYIVEVSDKNVLMIKDREWQYEVHLTDRLMQFAVDTLQLLMTLPLLKELNVIRYQLSKSATSIGANYEESQAGSYSEFRQRIQICLRVTL